MNNSRDIALAALDVALAEQIKQRFGMILINGPDLDTRGQALRNFTTGLKALHEVRDAAIIIVTKEFSE